MLHVDFETTDEEHRQRAQQVHDELVKLAPLDKLASRVDYDEDGQEMWQEFRAYRSLPRGRVAYYRMLTGPAMWGDLAFNPAKMIADSLHRKLSRVVADAS